MADPGNIDIVIRVKTDDIYITRGKSPHSNIADHTFIITQYDCRYNYIQRISTDLVGTQEERVYMRWMARIDHLYLIMAMTEVCMKIPILLKK